MQMKCLVIIPSHNEEKNILNVIKDITDNLDSNFSYIVIDDCSEDNTLQLLKDNNIDYIHLPINLGLTGAVQCGYKYAYINNYDAAIQFDGDGQHQARYLPDMIKEIENGNNIVIGSRFIKGKRKLSLRTIGNMFLSFLIKLKTGKSIKDPTSGMRMIDRKNIYEYANNLNYRPEPDSLVSQIKKGNIVKEVHVTMKEREYGESYLTSPFSSIKYMVKMIVSIIFIS